MTGMKEGAGEDPFADDADASPAETGSGSEAETVSDEPSTTSGATTTSRSTTEADEKNEDSAEAVTDERDSAASTPENDGQGESQRRSLQIPYKFRRDGVQDGRSRVPLFLQPETKRAEREALRELEDRFGDSVSLTDLREALVLAGLEHLDEVEERFADWGYGMTFDQ